MAVVALAVFVLYIALATVRPLVAARRRTGDWGFRTSAGAARVISALFPCVYAASLLGLVLDLSDKTDRIAAVDGPVARGAGLVVAVIGLPVIVLAQETMGRSWRIGVDLEERTELVTDGLFRRIRNPIYTGMVCMALGVALLVPNAATVAGLVLLLVAIELQARVVEEPYLLESHGDRFRKWAASSGRFLPGIGKLRPPAD